LQKDAELLAQNYNADYFPCNSTQDIAVNPLFNAMMENITGFIGNNMELQNLIGKNVSVGKRIFSHPVFLNNLKDNSLFKN
jgi:hypothetical protein